MTQHVEPKHGRLRALHFAKLRAALKAKQAAAAQKAQFRRYAGIARFMNRSNQGLEQLGSLMDNPE